MKKEQMEQERARSAYVPPYVESHVAELPPILAGSWYSGTHKPGIGGEGDLDGGGDHKPGIGGNGDLEAKRFISDLRFSDVWEE